MSFPVDVKMETPITIKTEQEEFEDLTIYSIFPTEEESNNFIPVIKTEIPEEIVNSRLHVKQPKNVGKNKSRKIKAQNHPIKQESSQDSTLSEEMSLFNQVSILKNFQCLTCGQLFYTQQEKIKHIRNLHQRERQFRCKVEGCGRIFPSSRNSFLKHLESHKNRGFTCPTCNKWILKEIVFKVHQSSCGITKEEGNRSSCTICNKTFANKYGLQKHFSNEHDEKRMKHNCESCGMRFMYKDVYLEHLASHFYLKIYDCDHCKEKFEDLSELNSHLSIYHSHVKPFRCGECKKTFNQRIALIRHEWKHKPELKQWYCEVCMEKFGVKADLRRHLKEHEKNEEKKFLNCDKCSKKFAVPQMLELHIAFHNLKEVKPFSCEGCELRFKTKEKMENHFKIH